jgi:hypothetical protein
MSIVIDGTGTISGVSATGLSAVQNLPAGTVKQIVSSTLTTSVTFSSATMTDTGLTVTLTPTNSSSKFLIIALGIMGGTTGATSLALNIVRNGTAIDISTASTTANFTSVAVSPNALHSSPFAIEYLDSPATASAITYKIQAQNQSGYTMYLNRNAALNTTSDTYGGGYTSTLVVMEIAG